jgi:hypothetical protein
MKSEMSGKLVGVIKDALKESVGPKSRWNFLNFQNGKKSID